MDDINNIIDKASKQSYSYHHINLRATLVQKALEILSTDGIDGLTLRRVSGAAGVSHAAPAHYFRDKKGLLAAVAAEGFRTLTADTVAATQDCRNPKKLLQNCVKSYVRFAQREPQVFRLLFGTIELNSSEYPELHEVAMNHWNLCIQLFKTAIEGLGFNDDGELLGFCIWAYSQGIASLTVNQTIIPPHMIPLKEAMLDKSIELLYAGLIANLK